MPVEKEMDQRAGPEVVMGHARIPEQAPLGGIILGGLAALRNDGQEPLLRLLRLGFIPIFRKDLHVPEIDVRPCPPAPIAQGIVSRLVVSHAGEGDITPECSAASARPSTTGISSANGELEACGCIGSTGRSAGIAAFEESPRRQENSKGRETSMLFPRQSKAHSIPLPPASRSVTATSPPKAPETANRTGAFPSGPPLASILQAIPRLLPSTNHTSWETRARDVKPLSFHPHGQAVRSATPTVPIPIHHPARLATPDASPARTSAGAAP